MTDLYWKHKIETTKNKINLAAPYCNMHKKLFFFWHCISLIQFNG